MSNLSLLIYFTDIISKVDGKQELAVLPGTKISTLEHLVNKQLLIMFLGMMIVDPSNLL